MPFKLTCSGWPAPQIDASEKGGEAGAAPGAAADPAETKDCIEAGPLSHPCTYTPGGRQQPRQGACAAPVLTPVRSSLPRPPGRRLRRP